MSKRSDELTAILKVPSGAPAGVSVVDLAEALESMGMTRRTLQRRLRELVEDGRLAVVGEGRGRRYRPLAEPEARTAGQLEAGA